MNPIVHRNYTPRQPIILILMAFAWWGFSASSVPAQTAPVFSLSISPELPFAGDRVTVTVVPENFTATSTTYQWSRDGAVLPAASGRGRETLLLITDPAATEIIQIRVVVNPGPGFNPGEQSLSIITIPNPAQQQEALDELKSGFTLEASESNPNPGERVTVRVKTFAFDKNTATYRWFVNGALERQASGRGKSEIMISAGSEGKRTSVQVEVTTLDGLAKTKGLTIQTASVVLYWWADTTTPYWYRGKALPSANARVTVIAIPPAGFGASDLSYQWQFNGAVIPQASGFGKQTFTFPFDFPVRERVEVTMRNLDGTFIKTAGIDVEPRLPTVAIYEVRPLRGVVQEKQLTDFAAPSGDSYDFLAAPFFFPRGREKTLRYRWMFNGREVTGDFDQPWRFTLKSNAGETSTSRLDIEVADPIQAGGRSSASFQVSLR